MAALEQAAAEPAGNVEPEAVTYCGNSEIEHDMLAEAVEKLQAKDFHGCLQQLKQIDPKGEIAEELSYKNAWAVCLWQHQDKFEEALQIFQEILLSNPDLTSVENNMRQVQTAIKYRDFNRISALVREQKLAEAEEQLRAFDMDEPCTPFLRFNVANTLGIVLVTIKRKLRPDGKTYYSVLPDAVQYFEIALEGKPDCLEAMHNLALTLSQLKKWDDSLEYFDQALAIKPQLVPALLGKATSLQRLREWTKTIEVATTILGITHDSDFRPWYIRGAARFALKDFEKAVPDMEKALEVGHVSPSELPGVQKTLIKALSKLSETRLFADGDAAAAVQLCDRALATTPTIDSPAALQEKRHALFNKGLALFALGHTDQAVGLMQDLVDQHPDDLPCREALGQLALLVEDYQLGIAHLEVALANKVRPSRANLMFDLGAAYFKMGDWENAKRCFQRVLKEADRDHEHAIAALQAVETILRGAPEVIGPDFIPGEFTGEKEGYTFSTKGPKGEGYYRNFREYLKNLGWSDDMIDIMFKTGGLGEPPNMSDVFSVHSPDLGGPAQPSAAPPSYASPAEVDFMYDFLKSPGPYPPEVDPTIREQYLDDEEFTEVLGQTKEAFAELPKWKQAAVKKTAGLF